MRYSTSFIAAIVISFLLFLGMSLLITNKNSYQSSDFEISNFNMIEEMDSPLKVKQEKPKIPEKEKMKQPPAAPKIEITHETKSRPDDIPTGKANLKNMELSGLNILPLPNLTTGKNRTYNEGELTLVAGMQPMYPPDAARAGIEGWVKVEISVDAFGLVNDVKILDSKPKRVFDNVTKRAMLKSKFKPLVVDGIAMAQTATQVIEFKLDK